MLKGLTKTWKDGCNALTLTYSEYIIIDNKKIPVKAVLKDDCYNNGNFIGSFIFKEISFETENNIDFKKKEFEYYKTVNGESIKLGTFITTEIKDNDTTELVKVVGMDFGLKTQIEYISSLDYSSGLITLLDVWNECCELSGLVSGINNFTNSDFIVENDQFTGTGATVRDVFIAIAQSSCSFVKVMNDDKIYLVFNEQTDDMIEDYTELEDKRDTQPITCVRLGMSQIIGENVDLKDEELVKEYGEHWLIINDNPFAYTQAKRAELIYAILDKVKGFGYSAFSAKTSFKPYLTCGDLIRCKNRNGQIIKSILLRYEHNYEEIKLEAPSETSATVNYVYPANEIDLIKRTEVIVDKHENKITSLTQQTQTIQDNLESDYYTIKQTDELVQTSSQGVTNTFSEAGGNNIFKNTPLTHKNDSVSDDSIYPSDELFPSNDLFPMITNSSYEFWEGNVVKGSNDKSITYNSMLLQNGSLSQEQEVPNGNYSVSFFYQKLNSLANASVVINDMEYPLDSMDVKQFYSGEKNNETGEYIVQPIVVSSNHIKIEFKCDVNNGVEIWDLMCNKGTVKLAWSQNQNEITTETVNISKGITITSTNIEAIFKANANGIRILTLQGSVVAYFTDKGLSTKELIVENKAQICGTLVQEIGNQTWWTRM